ncbi:MAG: M24 family metallopeptidase, partial [Rickettsiaceae bacterium]|nr:M24 family metallopeptidase [Rickettsiaceae bacterium]
MAIKIHRPEDFIGMRSAGKLAAEVLDYITSHVDEGVTTNYLNDLCHEFIVNHGAIPAPLNYRGFPKSICTSINHVVCHGIPNDKKLKSGDILNIDVTVILDGWFGDSSRMYFVGEPSIKAKRLTQVTYDAMMIGIEMVKPGVY